MVIGDLIVIVLIAAVLVAAVVFLIRAPKAPRAKELWYLVITAAGVLVLRFIIGFIPERYIGRIPNEVLLAVASGAIASGLILWLGRPGPERFETESYEGIWTFKDGTTANQLLMRFRILYDRTNLTSQPIFLWHQTLIEPYLWSTGVSVIRLQCASAKGSFDAANPKDPPQSIPHKIDGFVVELDEQHADHDNARLKPGERKWFLLEIDASVPETYWDIAVGTTTLGRPPEFMMIDETSKGRLALVLAGANGQYATNVDDHGSRLGKEAKLFIDEALRERVRAQVYWYPVSTLAAGSTKHLRARFAGASR